MNEVKEIAIEDLRSGVRNRILNALMERASNTGMRINVAEGLAEDIMQSLFEEEHNAMFMVTSYMDRLNNKEEKKKSS